MMATTALVYVFATFFCLAASSPTALPGESEEFDAQTLINGFRDELTELKDLVSILQDRLAEQRVEIDSKKTTEGLVVKVVRQRRDVDSPVSGLLGSSNTSDAGTEDPNHLTDYHSATVPKGGVVYTHWGRSDCPDRSKLVYEGTVTGAYYTHGGSGSNYLCMPLEPIYDEVEASAHASRALLYSAEFETSTAPAFADLHDQTPACAVCRAPPTRLTKLMLPGRNECPSSEWRLEYRGYLMSGLYTHKRTEFICMDREAEAVPGTTGSQDGAMMYMTEARCMSGGGLPCGPYVNGHELTCAVCTI